MTSAVESSTSKKSCEWNKFGCVSGLFPLDKRLWHVVRLTVLFIIALTHIFSLFFFSSFLFRQRRYANKPHKYAIHVRVNDFPSFLFLSSKLINLQEVRYIFIYYRLTVYSYRWARRAFSRIHFHIFTRWFSRRERGRPKPE